MEFNNKNIKTLKSTKYIIENGFNSREECFEHYIKEETANRTLSMSEVERILKTNGQWIRFFNPNTMTKEILVFAVENNVFAAKHLHLFPNLMTKEFVKECVSSDEVSYTFWKHFSAYKLFTKEEIQELELYTIDNSNIDDLEYLLNNLFNKSLPKLKRLDFSYVYDNLNKIKKERVLYVINAMVQTLSDSDGVKEENQNKINKLLQKIIDENLICEDTKESLHQLYDNLYRHLIGFTNFEIKEEFVENVFDKAYLLNINFDGYLVNYERVSTYEKLEKFILKYKSKELLDEFIKFIKTVGSSQRSPIYRGKYVPSLDFLHDDFIKNSEYKYFLIELEI